MYNFDEVLEAREEPVYESRLVYTRLNLSDEDMLIRIIEDNFPRPFGYFD